MRGSAPPQVRRVIKEMQAKQVAIDYGRARKQPGCDVRKCTRATQKKLQLGQWPGEWLTERHRNRGEKHSGNHYNSQVFFALDHLQPVIGGFQLQANQEYL